jgi:hypothetical protein
MLDWLAAALARVYGSQVDPPTADRLLPLALRVWRDFAPWRHLCGDLDAPPTLALEWREGVGGGWAIAYRSGERVWGVVPGHEDLGETLALWLLYVAEEANPLIVVAFH